VTNGRTDGRVRCVNCVMRPIARPHNNVVESRNKKLYQSFNSADASVITTELPWYLTMNNLVSSDIWRNKLISRTGTFTVKASIAVAVLRMTQSNDNAIHCPLRNIFYINHYTNNMMCMTC